MITSSTNPRIKYIRRLQTDRRFRWRENAFVVEGTRWVAELTRSAVTPNHVFCTDDWLASTDHDNILQQLGAPSQVVSDQIMATISDTRSPPGVLAVVPMPKIPLPPEPSLLLVLDEVTNPGNLGTILRSASAVGVDGVLLAPNCVDSFNPKVVRGSMGAHLRLPIDSIDWPELAHRSKGLNVWLAAADGEVDYTAVDWTLPSALIIGNEARGAGEIASRLARGTVSIPMHAATESLNVAVAASVILFEAARQRHN